MRYPIIFGAAALASVALATAPAPVQSQTTTDKVEQKADQAWQKTKDVTRDATTAMSDSWLTAKTKIALFADERVKGNQISVETLDGRVTLRGKVDSDAAKTVAASITGSVEGVRGVTNDLQVVPPGDRTAVDVSDDGITRQVKGGLAQDARLRDVDVRTDGGVVSLTGAVPSIDASARASEIAWAASARPVKNQLTYDPAPSTGRAAAVRAPGSHTRVKVMQQALTDRGFDPGPVDGVMGSRTTSALRDYQKSENLTVTGQLDVDTAAKLATTPVSSGTQRSR
jgi:osmotically-inducible protein OsmY